MSVLAALSNLLLVPVVLSGEGIRAEHQGLVIHFLL